MTRPVKRARERRIGERASLLTDLGDRAEPLLALALDFLLREGRMLRDLREDAQRVRRVVRQRIDA